MAAAFNRNSIKRLFFYWISSSLLAIGVYYLLWLIMPEHEVFGRLFHMQGYHRRHPVPFILIPCFFYGIIATLFANVFFRSKVFAKILLTLLILVLTVVISSPFGGMLWQYYDMKAGYFPESWFTRMISRGFSWGLPIGWIIVVLSVPYNIIGAVMCYFLTKKGSEVYHTPTKKTEQ